jgi:hypothetical protein
MPDFSLLFAKARALGNPLLAAAVIAGTVAWAARGIVDGNAVSLATTAATVARLDSNTVKRAEFDALVLEFRRYAANGDSTNRLLRRFICASHREICP